MTIFLCRTRTTTISNGLRHDIWSDLGTLEARNIGAAWNKAKRRWPKAVESVYAVLDPTTSVPRQELHEPDVDVR